MNGNPSECGKYRIDCSGLERCAAAGGGNSINQRSFLLEIVKKHSNSTKEMIVKVGIFSTIFCMIFSLLHY